MTADPLRQLEREPARAYERFTYYAHAGPDRSLARAAKAAGCSESTMRAHAREWHWASRVEAFDRQHLSQLNTLAMEQSTADHLDALNRFKDGQLEQAERLSTAGLALLAAAVRALDALKARNEDLPPNAIASAVTAAAKVLEASSERAATCLGVEELLQALSEHLDDGEGARLPPAG